LYLRAGSGGNRETAYERIEQHQYDPPGGESPGVYVMKWSLGISVLLVIGAVGLQAPALRAAPAAQPSGATLPIGVSAFDFDPADRTIATGDTIEWSWSTSPDEHNVRFTSGSETSGAPAVSDTYSRTFTSAGTYDYYCEVHGTAQGGGMAGTITVQAAATNTPGQATATRTRTRTPTPESTGTVVGTVTPVPTLTPVTPPPPVTNTPAPIVSAVPTTPGGGSGGAVTAPDTGGGDGGGVGAMVPWWVSVVVVVGGLVVVGGGWVSRRVR
jgi:plastocyanin